MHARAPTRMPRRQARATSLARRGRHGSRSQPSHALAVAQQEHCREVWASLRSVNARAPALGFIFVTLLLDVLGIGIIIPVGPKLVEMLQGGGDEAAAPIVGALGATYAAMLFVFAPILGALSDRFGRRPVLLVSMLGSGLDYFAMALAPSVPWLFVTRALNGVSGASMATANAYIADVTSPEKRAGAYGMVGAAFGLGFVLGPLLGGVLGEIDIRLPFYAAGAMALANAAFGLFVLPESLPKEKRNPTPLSVHPTKTIGVLFRYPLAARLSMSLFLLNVAQFALHATWVFYCARRYDWGTKDVGYSLFAVGIGAVIVQGGLTRRIVPKLGNERSLLLGVFIGVLAYSGYALASEGWMLYAAIGIASLGGIAMPACQALITKSVDPREQGAVQGGLSGMQSLANVAGPLVGSSIYEWSITGGRDNPSLVYWNSAGLAALCLVLVAAALRKNRSQLAAMAPR